ncbi:MAG: hypothetical protein CBB87_12210 [Micavibrio sp. TMED27]|nr:hypothetical protein [Micavibrio sp.]OUT89730.1 MAG: hypothetical protein CBB87_12210 [Micavibrio sp. TMED27]|tara:strand:+ start:907 stop:1194 length:288 start_codon:yes stop_codon:yes gene_type:complete
MNIELGVLHDGRITLVSDAPLPDIVRRVEYYRDQRLFQLVYKEQDKNEDKLLECEIPDNFADPIEKSPNVIIFSIFPDMDPLGYKVPLIKVGALY